MFEFFVGCVVLAFAVAIGGWLLQAMFFAVMLVIASLAGLFGKREG